MGECNPPGDATSRRDVFPAGAQTGRHEARRAVDLQLDAGKDQLQAGATSRQEFALPSHGTPIDVCMIGSLQL